MSRLELLPVPHWHIEVGGKLKKSELDGRVEWWDNEKSVRHYYRHRPDHVVVTCTEPCKGPV